MNNKQFYNVRLEKREHTFMKILPFAQLCIIIKNSQHVNSTGIDLDKQNKPLVQRKQIMTET